MEPYIGRYDKNILTKLDEDNVEKFITFAQLNSNYYNDIYNKMNDPNYYD